MAKDTANRYLNIVNRIGQYVYDHSDQNITLDDLAHHVAISKYHLNRIFSAATGYQLGEFVQRRKLSKALHNIQNGNHSLIDVALSIGYNSPSAFSRAFHQVFGLTPSDIIQGKTLAKSGQRKPPKFIDKQAPQPEITTLEAKTLYGLYGQGFEDQSFRKVANTLYQQLVAMAEPLPFEALQPVGVSIDNPWVGQQKESRFFAGLCAGLDHCQGDLETYLWPGGTWAKFTHTGPHQSIWQTIVKVYAQWAIPNNIEFTDTAIIQRYLNNAFATAPEALETELYFGIQKAP